MGEVSGTDPGANLVAEIMRRNVVTVDPGENVLEAEQIMRLARIRHLPVVKDRVLVGLLSHRDVLEASMAALEGSSPKERAEHLRRIPIEKILRGKPRAVEADCSLRDAALTMLRLKIGCLPVVEPGPRGARLLGIITESDLLRAAYVAGSAGTSD